MKFQIKNSDEILNGNAVEPNTSYLEYGELVLNYNVADPKIFFKLSDDSLSVIPGGTNTRLSSEGLNSTLTGVSSSQTTATKSISGTFSSAYQVQDQLSGFVSFNVIDVETPEGLTFFDDLVAKVNAGNVVISVITNLGVTHNWTLTTVDQDTPGTRYRFGYVTSQAGLFLGRLVEEASFDDLAFNITITDSANNPMMDSSRPVTIDGVEYAASKWSVSGTSASQIFFVDPGLVIGDTITQSPVLKYSAPGYTNVEVVNRIDLGYYNDSSLFTFGSDGSFQCNNLTTVDQTLNLGIPGTGGTARDYNINANIGFFDQLVLNAVYDAGSTQKMAEFSKTKQTLYHNGVSVLDTNATGIDLLKGSLKFGPNTAQNDDAHIEWLGGSNTGYLRFSTADDNGTEYMEFGDYDTTNKGGAFTQWMQIQRGSMSMTGTITATGSITENSDITLKKNIEVISNALEKLQQIRGVTFDRKDIDGYRQAGVIAQEVEKVLPEVVHDTPAGIRSVAYGNLVSLLIEAVKEQQLQIESLTERVNQLNNT